MSTIESPLAGAVHTEVGGVSIDEVAAGASRVKRVVYPPGWTWDAMAEVVGSEWCEHAHIGFVVQGAMSVVFRDGCEVVLRAPAAAIVEPGHKGEVLGDEAVVLIQVDCGVETTRRLGLEGLDHHERA